MQECKSRLYPLFIDKKLNELVSLHAGIAAQDLGPALAHLINLCSSPSKEYAEFVMNFGMRPLFRGPLKLTLASRTKDDDTTCAPSLYSASHGT